MSEDDDRDASADRQRIVRVPGSRRARLTPAPGTTAEPVADDETTDAASPTSGEGAASGTARGPNDDRMRQDVPPHY